MNWEQCSEAFKELLQLRFKGEKTFTTIVSKVTEIIASHDNEIELQMVHQVGDAYTGWFF